MIGVTVRNIPRKVMQRSLTVADLCGSDKEEWHDVIDAKRNKDADELLFLL